MRLGDYFGNIDYRDELTASGTHTIIPAANVPTGMRCYVTKVEMDIETMNGQIVVQEEGGGKIHFDSDSVTGSPDMINDGFGSKNNASGTGLEVVLSGAGPHNVEVHVCYNLQPDA